MNTPNAKTVESYLDHYSGDTRARLETLRTVITSIFPEAIEDISYQMPAYRLKPGKRPFIFFGASKNHIGIYALHEALTPELQKELASHITGRGTLQFQNTEPLPLKLIEKLLMGKRFELGL